MSGRLGSAWHRIPLYWLYSRVGGASLRENLHLISKFEETSRQFLFNSQKLSSGSNWSWLNFLAKSEWWSIVHFSICLFPKFDILALRCFPSEKIFSSLKDSNIVHIEEKRWENFQHVETGRMMFNITQNFVFVLTVLSLKEMVKLKKYILCCKLKRITLTK